MKKPNIKNEVIIDSSILNLQNHVVLVSSIIAVSKLAVKDGDGKSGVCIHLISGSSIIEYFQLGETDSEEQNQAQSESQRDLFIDRIIKVLTNK